MARHRGQPGPAQADLGHVEDASSMSRRAAALEGCDEAALMAVEDGNTSEKKWEHGVDMRSYMCD